MNYIAYIRLQNVDQLKNKHRLYALAISEYRKNNIDTFTVYISWGRSPTYQRQQTIFFSTKTAMLTHVQTILQRRKQHGYKIIEKSSYFPQVKALESLPYGNRVGEQLSLF